MVMTMAMTIGTLSILPSRKGLERKAKERKGKEKRAIK